ncbi:hypothetical protein RKD21_002514 [Streptomyces albogriseolus]|uniref:Uncharacterized protein n=1 Tax=Streptomyces albogriseolus TaxID=1887 RepID=A0ACC6UL69_STRAO
MPRPDPTPHPAGAPVRPATGPRPAWQGPDAHERGAALPRGAAPRPPRTRAPFLPEPEGRQMPSGSGSAPAFAARAYHSALDFGVRFWLT